MLDVYRVGLKNSVVVCCRWVNVLVNFAGDERGVVEVADNEGYGVRGRWQVVAAPTNKVLSKSLLCVEAEVEATAPAPAPGGPAAASASGAWGVGVGAIVVARHCIWFCVGRLR